MKQFLKITMASCLGTMLFFFGGFVLLIMIGSLSADSEQISRNSVLHLTLDHTIPELTDNIEPGQFGFSTSLAIGLNDITRLIRHASDDESIKGILLQTQAVTLNPTSAYSIAEEILRFKESGKFVYAYGDYFTQSGYIIGAVADSVFLNPNGLVDLRGYGVSTPYFEEFSQKTGVDFDVYHAGKYKSAVEPYYRSESSDENRYQTKQYLNNFHDALVGHISKYRLKEISEIENIVSNGLSNNHEDAMSFGLVDKILYFKDIELKIDEQLNDKPVSFVKLEKYYKAHRTSKLKSDNKIAVIYAEGTVMFGGDERGGISMGLFEKAFDQIEKNDDIEAVILRVNSPGGSSFTSDVFWKRVRDLKESGKYVIASFGDYAASGGYYIAADVDKIVSAPTTLTGSIGVYSMMPNFNDFSKEHLGINWDTISTGKRTFIYSSMIERSEEDNALLMAETERFYRQFKEVVASGRNLEVEDVQKIAQGRVWSGIDAVEVGLVDTLGSLSDAIDIVAAKFDYDNHKLLEYPIIKKDIWDTLLEGITSKSNVKIAKNQGLNSPIIDDLMMTLRAIEQACHEPQARLPFSILIH